MAVQGSISNLRRRPFLWLVALAIFVALTYLVLAAQAGSRPESACESGAISAIGPVDAAGNGDTTPEIHCLP